MISMYISTIAAQKVLHHQPVRYLSSRLRAPKYKSLPKKNKSFQASEKIADTPFVFNSFSKRSNRFRTDLRCLEEETLFVSMSQNFSASSLTPRKNKLDRLFLSKLFSLVLYKPEPVQLAHLTLSLCKGTLLALSPNARLG